MARKLLIVESPAKAKTISKYLDNEFTVLASFGHVRDLPKKNGSIDVNNDFLPKYQLIAKNQKHVDEILAAAKKADTIFLASDQDREGEAIAWHITEILRDNNLCAGRHVARVTFNEITKPAILEAVAHPRQIDANLVDAQQARLTLDYLIGFNVSPLLWRKIKPGLSAGRVQSPALRLICEREDEIKKFVPEDYFGVHLFSHKERIKFRAKLIEHAGTKIETRTITTEQYAKDIVAGISGIEQAKIRKVSKKQKKKNPTAPFITSSLQIESSRQLGFATDRTMRIAQTLYEGVALGKESVGLITYMRTDSVQLSAIAIEEIREYITANFDGRYLPAKANVYISKSKNAQEAHEAIRPTSILRTPDSVKAYLNADQFKLYELIWRRTLASQISPAVLDTTAIDFELGNTVFRANGVMVNFDGFMKVYQETFEDSVVNEDEEARLPELVEGEMVPVDSLDITAHQTEPKPRYTEASLVKALEELGIGRPSTYASIIATLKKREYVVMDKKRFVPTEIGAIVSLFLTNHLTKYVDLQFTANLEDTLDNIAIGKSAKLPTLHQFWDELHALVTEKQNISKMELTSEKLDENCPECGKPLISRFGKYGRFIGCSGYPECNYMRKVDKDGNSEVVAPPEEVEGRVCPKDGGKLLIRNGKFGKFISCANYPKCKHIENMDTPEVENAVGCPECKKGKVIPKKGRFGVFYSCNNYPECKTIFKYEPISANCPECNYPVMMVHTTKTKGTQHICPKCKHSVKV
ncbi:MAG TPA: type I DNA topoisomerase [Burkholderiales bacterium]|jgi:DNA topoisomerase-1|nr:type I DNA topoisomerase [Burkholderiales bacterium]